MPLTGPVGLRGLPSCATSWNDPTVAAPVLTVGNCGPVSVTAPTNALGGMPVPVTPRPVSSATMALSEMMLEDAAPVAPLSVRAPGVVPEPPRTMPGTQLAGVSGLVEVQAGGRSMKLLLPGPGYSWSPWLLVASVEFGPVGSVLTFLPNRFSPAVSAAKPVLAFGWSEAVGS